MVSHRLRRVAQYLRLVATPGEVGSQQAVTRGASHPDSELVVIVVFAPSGPAADAVRNAAARAGAGAIGDYRACSFSARGDGRFEPTIGANPTIGEVGSLETVDEQRIEVVCLRYLAGIALREMLAAHPYEEPAHHVYATIRPEEL